MPLTPDELLKFLADLGVATQTVTHPPLHTVGDSQRLRGEIDGAHAKNLFVKDKKSRLFLISALEDCALDLKSAHQALGGQGRVSFGSAELLEEVWGVKPGSVTPFGAVNDIGRRVSVVLDEELMRHALLNFHPLTNTRTTTIASADLIRFLDAVGHAPLIVRLPRVGGT